MVGARIENREITIKEDLAEAPAEVVEEVAEAPVAEETTENKAEQYFKVVINYCLLQLFLLIIFQKIQQKNTQKNFTKKNN